MCSILFVPNDSESIVKGLRNKIEIEKHMGKDFSYMSWVENISLLYRNNKYDKPTFCRGYNTFYGGPILIQVHDEKKVDTYLKKIEDFNKIQFHILKSILIRNGHENGIAKEFKTLNYVDDIPANVKYHYVEIKNRVEDVIEIDEMYKLNTDDVDKIISNYYESYIMDDATEFRNSTDPFKICPYCQGEDDECTLCGNDDAGNSLLRELSEKDNDELFDELREEAECPPTQLVMHDGQDINETERNIELFDEVREEEECPPTQLVIHDVQHTNERKRKHTDDNEEFKRRELEDYVIVQHRANGPISPPTGLTKESWHCTTCNISMGPTNPRQHCGKGLGCKNIDLYHVYDSDHNLIEVINV